MTRTAPRTLVFDCDGVVLASNAIKTEAFRRVAGARYGEAAAQALVEHHVRNGGVSRFEKFRYLVEDIVGAAPDPAECESLCTAYGEEVFARLLECEVAPGLEPLRASTPDARWMIVSGGAQHELREVFRRRGLDTLFDAGIFGSPDSKDAILAREIATGNLRKPAAFFGDSAYDHRAATAVGLDFVFVSDWSELPDWAGYCARHGLPHRPTLADAVRFTIP